MRFILKFQLSTMRIPIEIRRTMISFIKKSLTQAHDGKYYENFFKDTELKDYCFSIIYPLKQFHKNEIELKKPEISVVFSCTEKQNIAFLLMNVFLLQKNKKFPFPDDEYMILKEIVPVREKEILGNVGIFRSTLGGGIVVREHIKEEKKDIYYSVGDEKFLEKLDWIMKKRFERLGYPKEMIQFSSKLLEGKKVIVKHFGLTFPVTNGIFEIYAPKILLKEIYRTGLGSRLSQGLGMLEYLGPGGEENEA
ncbi:CRISPR-associated endoribonuclease Cas6 [Fusobacterium gonidiaformans 3-1-5R]|uniref:CRISPR-associated endoribonuclease Cas6 n=1 Tax=Fusobacterium gonidiaformans 3-1-5R TaxID=469605 RepID=E5BGM1_9FUSO|nr:CRISPR-associated endoribonuclease Cas6 [Fusobacterium gonidiaformans]EFS21644.1 CRISPR-associated endoribonuclease Cas6 [Fusobacterium gonidiaformans 3-1-5R]